MEEKKFTLSAASERSRVCESWRTHSINVLVAFLTFHNLLKYTLLKMWNSRMKNMKKRKKIDGETNRGHSLFFVAMYIYICANTHTLFWSEMLVPAPEPTEPATLEKIFWTDPTFDETKMAACQCRCKERILQWRINVIFSFLNNLLNYKVVFIIWLCLYLMFNRRWPPLALRCYSRVSSGPWSLT